MAARNWEDGCTFYPASADSTLQFTLQFTRRSQADLIETHDGMDTLAAALRGKVPAMLRKRCVLVRAAQGWRFWLCANLILAVAHELARRGAQAHDSYVCVLGLQVQVRVGTLGTFLVSGLRPPHTTPLILAPDSAPSPSSSPPPSWWRQKIQKVPGGCLGVDSSHRPVPSAAAHSRLPAAQPVHFAASAPREASASASAPADRRAKAPQAAPPAFSAPSEAAGGGLSGSSTPVATPPGPSAPDAAAVHNPLELHGVRCVTYPLHPHPSRPVSSHQAASD